MTVSSPEPRFGRAALPCLALTFLLVGCQSKSEVSGRVTFQGQPLVFGTVMFEASDGSLHHGNIDTEGHYSISNITPGPAKVAVSSRNPASSDFQLLRLEGDPPPPPRPEIPGWFPIPARYDETAKSGLEYPLNPGANSIDIDLHD